MSGVMLPDSLDNYKGIQEVVAYSDGEFETLRQEAFEFISQGMRGCLPMNDDEVRQMGRNGSGFYGGMSMCQYFACEGLFRAALYKLCKTTEKDSFPIVGTFVEDKTDELLSSLNGVVAATFFSGVLGSGCGGRYGFDWLGLAVKTIRDRMGVDRSGNIDVLMDLYA